MRKTKFRAWMPKEHKWYRGGAIQLGAALGNSFALSDANGKIIELQEYTGLKDKNGKEVYEGDIVSQSGYTGLVDFYEGSFYKKETNHNVGRGSKQMLLSQCASRSEVIGNIYENPELLTTKQGVVQTEQVLGDITKRGEGE